MPNDLVFWNRRIFQGISWKGRVTLQKKKMPEIVFTEVKLFCPRDSSNLSRFMKIGWGTQDLPDQ